MKLLIVDAPGVLYPAEKQPPNTDPITSGVLLVKRIMESMGISTLVTAQANPAALREWCLAFDITYTWHVQGEPGESAFDYWDKEVMGRLGALRAAPAACVTADERVAERLAAEGVPTLQFRPPGGMPDWAPRSKSWINTDPEE